MICKAHYPNQICNNPKKYNGLKEEENQEM